MKMKLNEDGEDVELKCKGEAVVEILECHVMELPGRDLRCNQVRWELYEEL